MAPAPKTKTSMLCAWLKKNKCATFTAMSPYSPDITTDIERSDEPWAIARMFISREASESKKVPATPRFFFIPSPTIDTMAQFSCTSIGFISPSAISISNSSFKTKRVFSVSFCFTQKVIVYSELDWVISKIETFARDTAEKIRAAMPCFPRIPAPETEIMAVFFKQVIPRTAPLVE